MTTDDNDYLRSPELLSARQSRLLIVDVQEKFVPHIPVAEEMIAGCKKLIRGAGILNVPVFATEQYPQGLGSTVPALAQLLDERPEKLRFSSAEVLNWEPPSADPQCRDQIVLAGIETHVCVLQSVLDFLSMGFRVYVPADAVASRRKIDWTFALKRMADSGATITTTESVLFEWAEAAGTPEFKEISRLVKS